MRMAFQNRSYIACTGFTVLNVYSIENHSNNTRLGQFRKLGFDYKEF